MSEIRNMPLNEFVEALMTCASNLKGERACRLMREAAVRLESAFLCLSPLDEWDDVNTYRLNVGDAIRTMNGVEE